MAKEYWYFFAGALVVALPVALFLAAKKFDLFEVRPDRRIAYTEVGGRPLHLHLFKAAGDSSRNTSPALLLFHGGGWHSGSARQFYPQCQFFARAGFTCISAEYRLGPAHAPDVRGAIADAASALDFLRRNAADLGLDPNRLFVGGGSSGGHLAATLGAGLHGAGQAKPAALVLFNPVVDLAPCTISHHRVREYWREVSPLQHVGEGFPPTLVLSGVEDREVPPEGLETFCDTVRESGGHCELELYPGQGHGFFNPREDDSAHFDKTNERALAFLRARSP